MVRDRDLDCDIEVFDIAKTAVTSAAFDSGRISITTVITTTTLVLIMINNGFDFIYFRLM
jgi:hypothetical protein